MVKMQLEFCHLNLVPLLIEHLNQRKSNSFAIEKVTVRSFVMM